VVLPSTTGTTSNSTTSCQSAILGDPALEQGDVVGLHELEAAAEIGRHVARDELEPVGQAAAAIAQLAIDRLSILIPERFYNHEEHVRPPASPLIYRHKFRGTT